MRLSNFVNGGLTSSTVTIEWTPSNQASVTYAVTVTPDPVAAVPRDASSTQATITLLYNTNYTVAISIVTMYYQRQETIPFVLGKSILLLWKILSYIMHFDV